MFIYILTKNFKDFLIFSRVRGPLVKKNFFMHGQHGALCRKPEVRLRETRATEGLTGPIRPIKNTIRVRPRPNFFRQDFHHSYGYKILSYDLLSNKSQALGIIFFLKIKMRWISCFRKNQKIILPLIIIKKSM